MLICAPPVSLGPSKADCLKLHLKQLGSQQLGIEPLSPRRATSILIAEPSPVLPNFNCNVKPKLITNETGAQKN